MQQELISKLLSESTNNYSRGKSQEKVEVAEPLK